MAAAIADLRCFVIPNPIVISALLFAVLGRVLEAFSLSSAAPLGKALAGAALGFALLAPFAKKGLMGMGDVKLLVVLGMFFGPFGMLAALALSSTIGGVACAALIALGKAGRKTMIPFGPFLSAGAMLQLAFGQDMQRFFEQHFLK
jgi:leader peptidase (prepilin peptidase)/N-methyltransferase